MNEYDIVENRIIDRLIVDFWDEFEFVYDSINVKGKSVIIKYSAAFFRKWYYSTLVEDTVITPSYIAEYGAEAENVYPVFKSNSASRIGSFEIKNIKYSIDNHPICNDFRKVVKAFNKGVVLNDELQMNFADIKKIGKITTFDVEYITYLIMLAIDLGYIEKMPSLGVIMYCTSKNAKKIAEMTNRNLLTELVNAGLKLSASYLSDDFLGEEYSVTADMVKDWIIKPKPVDKLFESAYGEIALEISESTFIEDMDEMERVIVAKAYARGVILDRWFLTPFSYYFRFINTTYMYEFSYYDEMMFLIKAAETVKETGDNTIIDTAIYAPCTMYRTSKLAREYFELPVNNNVPYLFKNMGVEEIIEGALDYDNDNRAKILNAYEPEYNIYTLKVTDEKNSNIKFKLTVKEDMTLDVLNTNMVDIFKTPVLICQSYRYYKLPESPFTEYTPSFLGLRGPHTENTTVKELLELGESCYYEIIKLNDNDEIEGRVFKVQLESITSSKNSVI